MPRDKTETAGAHDSKQLTLKTVHGKGAATIKISREKFLAGIAIFNFLTSRERVSLYYLP